MADTFAQRLTKLLGDHRSIQEFDRSKTAIDPETYRKTREALLRMGASSPSSTGEKDGQAIEDLVLNTTKSGGVEEEGDGWFPDSFGDVIDLGLKPVTVPLKAGGNVFMKAIDEVSRLPYAAFEGMRAHSEALNENQDQNVVERNVRSVDDILEGLWKGFTKQERTGFGEVVEESANRSGSSLPAGISQVLPFLGPAGQITSAATGGAIVPTSQIGEGLNELPPDMSQRLKQAYGFYGEVALDPLNLIGGKVAGTVGKGKKAVSYSDDAYKAVVGKAVGESMQEADLAKFVSNKRRFSTRVPTPTGAGTNRAVEWDKLYDVAYDAADDILPIHGGATKGRILGAVSSPRLVATTTAAHARSIVTKQFDEMMDIWEQAGRSLPKKQLDSMRAQNEAFDAAMDAYSKATVKNLPSQEIERLTREAGRQYFTDHFTKFTNILETKLMNELYNSPGLRIGAKEIPFRRVGLAYSKVQTHNMTKDLFKSVSHARQFVGRVALKNQKLRAVGMKAYENFHSGSRKGILRGFKMPEGKEVSFYMRHLDDVDAADIADHLTKRTPLKNPALADDVTEFVTKYTDDFMNKSVRDMARGYSHKERAILHQALLDGQRPTNPHLADGYDYIRKHYDDIFDNEVTFGVRKSKSKTDNYTYNYYRWGSKKKIDNFKEARKAYKGGKVADPDTLRKAKEANLLPVTDAFEALLLRKIKSNRRTTRMLFNEDLLDNYGVLAGDLSKESLESMRLKAVGSADVPKQLQDGLKAGEKFYLPDHIDDMRLAFKELLDSSDLPVFVRMVDRLTRYFKFSATLPFTGFHIRNGLGDMFMGFIDGVRFRHYTKLSKDLAASKAGKSVTYDIGDRTFSFEELRSLFQNNAQSGAFFSTEMRPGEVSRAITGAGVSRQSTKFMDTLVHSPSKTTDLFRTGSEAREDFFRFTHFLHAFRDEYPSAVKAAKGNHARALENAVQASTYRVNKYLFDYGALTRTEQQYLKRAIPFYTYARKVMPTMLESLFLEPKYISRAQRWGDPGTKEDKLDELLAPDYMREVGWATLKDEEEPWLLSYSFLPTSNVAENLNFSDTSAWFRHMLSQSNPAVKAVIEQATQENLFNESPIGPTGGQYIAKDVFPFTKPVGDWRDVILGRETDQETFSGNRFLDELLTNRIGVGMPVTQITEGRQNAALYEHRGAINDSLKTINENLEESGIRVYISDRKDGATYRVRNLVTNEVLYEGTDVNDVVQKAQQLAGR